MVEVVKVTSNILSSGSFQLVFSGTYLCFGGT